MGLFDIFKDKDEDEDSGGMAEETKNLLENDLRWKKMRMMSAI